MKRGAQVFTRKKGELVKEVWSVLFGLERGIVLRSGDVGERIKSVERCGVNSSLKKIYLEDKIDLLCVKLSVPVYLSDIRFSTQTCWFLPEEGKFNFDADAGRNMDKIGIVESILNKGYFAFRYKDSFIIRPEFARRFSNKTGLPKPLIYDNEPAVVYYPERLREIKQEAQRQNRETL